MSLRESKICLETSHAKCMQYQMLTLAIFILSAHPSCPEQARGERPEPPLPGWRLLRVPHPSGGDQGRVRRRAQGL